MSRQWLSTAMAEAVVRRYDPADTYRNALRAERRLGNAVLLTEDGQGYPTCADPGKCVAPPRGAVCRPDKAAFYWAP